MRFLYTVLPLAALACAEGAGGGDPFAAFTMPAVEELRIGTADDSVDTFTYFRELEVGPDGTIYTGHRQDHEIRMHDPSGALIGSVGREGEGPGEFDGIGPMGIVGDTLWVLDNGLYRISFFDLRGNLLGMRRVPIELGGPGPGAEPPRPTGLLRDGTIVGASPAWSHLVAAGEITQQAIVGMDTTGAAGDTIATYSLINSVWEISNHAQGQAYFGSYRNQPFTDTEIVQLSDYDMIGVRVDRSPPEADGAATFGVTIWRIDGDTVFSRRYAYEPIPLRTTIVDSIIDEFAEGVANSAFLAGRATKEQAEEWARAGLYVPTYHPPVSALVIARDGTLWLRGEELGEPTVRWRILSAEGDPMGVVELPAGFRMMYADGLQVWGSEAGELDVPQIVRYRVGATAP